MDYYDQQFTYLKSWTFSLINSQFGEFYATWTQFVPKVPWTHRFCLKFPDFRKWIIDSRKSVHKFAHLAKMFCREIFPLHFYAFWLLERFFINNLGEKQKEDANKKLGKENRSLIQIFHSSKSFIHIWMIIIIKCFYIEKLKLDVKISFLYHYHLIEKCLNFYMYV